MKKGCSFLLVICALLFWWCGGDNKKAMVNEGYEFCVSLLDAPSTANFIKFHPYDEIIPVISKKATVTLNEKCYIGCYEIEADNRYGGRGRHYFYVLWYNKMMYAESFPNIKNYKDLSVIDILSFLDTAAREIGVRKSDLYTNDESRLKQMIGF